MSYDSQPEALATPDQARELLHQIEEVTTRGHSLMDRFFFSEMDIVTPPRFEHLFPSLDHPEQYDRVGSGFLFSHRFAASVLGLDPAEDIATLTLSRNGYKNEKVVSDASMMYQVFVSDGQYRIEQRLSYEISVKNRAGMFNSDDVDAIAAYEARLIAEKDAERSALVAEGELGLLAVNYTTADDLITFAKSFNPHHAE